MTQSLFNGSCSTIMIPCEDGTRYIDPCSCVNYYICASREQIVKQNCSPGTAFNQSDCRRTAEVGCSVEEPWLRCQTVSGSKSEEELRNRCLNAASSSSSSSSSEAGNGGAIAGAVIAVLLVAVIVVCVVLYVRKRGNPIRHLKVTSLWRRKTQNVTRENKGVTSPVAHVSAAPSEEEVYACIDVAAMCRDEDLVTSTSPTARPNVNHNQNTYTVVTAGGTRGGNRQAVAHVTPVITGHSAQMEVTTEETFPSSSPLEDNIDHDNRDRWRTDGAGERPAENIPLDPQQYLLPRPVALDEEGSTMDPPYYELEHGGHVDNVYVNDVDDL